MTATCDVCGKNQAILHTTILDDNMGIESESHLCQKCAAFVVMHSVLAGAGKPAGKMSTTNKQCPTCKLTLFEFSKTGKLGCADCYEIFNKEIEEVAIRAHGAIKHTGRLPERVSAIKGLQDIVTKLELEMWKVVNVENYEEAAKLRDEIGRINSTIKELKNAVHKPKNEENPRQEN